MAKRPNEEATEIEVYAAAQRLLAARDHSVRELRKKLTQKRYPSDHIKTALDDFVERGWLNDQRFAELQSDSLVRQFWGPLKIVEKLVKHGVDRDLARGVVDTLDVSWGEVASQKAVKRFGDEFRDQPDAVFRYLTQRGFAPSTVRQLLFD